MDQSFEQPLEPVTPEPIGFVPYTAFPSIEQTLEEHLGAKSKFLLPVQHQDGFVRSLPWVAVLFLPLQFAGVALLLGLSALTAFAGSGSHLRALVSTAVFVLDVMALPGLFKRTRRGWAFFAYAVVLSAANSVFGMSILGLIINAAVLWLAFQVKYRYV
jgi:hypothetical protein